MGIIRLPNTFYQVFNRDPYEAARNILSIPLGALSPFFQKQEFVKKSIDDNLPEIFDVDKMRFVPGMFCDDGIPRYMHIDVGVSNNATGVSCCHVVDWKTIAVLDDGVETQVKLPVVVFDFVAKLFPPSGGEVFISDIRELIIYKLTDMGYNIRLITYDGFGSLESIQIMKRQGYIVGHLSLDRTTSAIICDSAATDNYRKESTDGNYTAAWDAFKQGIYDSRITVPHNDDYLKEAKAAERRTKGNRVKIDCQSDALTLDLLESMAGAYFNAINNEILDDLPDDYFDDPASDEDYKNYYKNDGVSFDSLRHSDAEIEDEEDI